MRHIGFKNFRRFTDFPNMKFGNITILVGSNNSGKSTIQKALMLTFDNIRSLRVPNLIKSDNVFKALDNNNIFRFDCNNIHDIHVDTFGRALNNETQEKALSFSLGLSDFDITLKLQGDDLSSPEAIITMAIIKDNKNHFTYEINYGQSVIKVISENQYDKLESKSESIEDKIKDLQEKISSEKSPIEIGRLNVELDNLQKLMKENKSDIVVNVNTKDNAIVIPLDRFIDVANENEFVNRIKGIYDYAYTPTTGDKRSNAYKEAVANKSQLKLAGDRFKDSANRLNDAIYNTPLEYIQAHAAFQKAVFSTEDKNDYTARTIYEFINSKITPNSDEYKFVTDWMKTFDIGSDFIIESLQGTAFSVRIFSDKKEKEEYVKGNKQKGVELADKGMGSNQLMLLLWKLAAFLRKYKDVKNAPTIIIEEPEQNLHPKVQSYLADLFKNLNDNFKFKFIIETHSEYFVRRSQVIVNSMQCNSKEELKKRNPFKVYYIQEKALPYEMEYRVDGKFANEFGTGFFDEASKLAFEIF